MHPSLRPFTSIGSRLRRTDHSGYAEQIIVVCCAPMSTVAVFAASTCGLDTNLPDWKQRTFSGIRVVDQTPRTMVFPCAPCITSCSIWGSLPWNRTTGESSSASMPSEAHAGLKGSCAITEPDCWHHKVRIAFPAQDMWTGTIGMYSRGRRERCDWANASAHQVPGGRR